MQGAGILRRITQGTQTLGSVFYRTFTQTSAPDDLVGYWSCEDGNTTAAGGTPATPTQFAAGLPGEAAGTFTGAVPGFASNQDFLCSQSLPTINGSRWHFRLPPRTTTDSANVFRFLCSVPAAGDTDGGTLARMFTAGSLGQVDLVYNTNIGGSLRLLGFNWTASTGPSRVRHGRPDPRHQRPGAVDVRIELLKVRSEVRYSAELPATRFHGRRSPPRPACWRHLVDRRGQRARDQRPELHGRREHGRHRGRPGHLPGHPTSPWTTSTPPRLNAWIRVNRPGTVSSGCAASEPSRSAAAGDAGRHGPDGRPDRRWTCRPCCGSAPTRTRAPVLGTAAGVRTRLTAPRASMQNQATAAHPGLLRGRARRRPGAQYHRGRPVHGQRRDGRDPRLRPRRGHRSSAEVMAILAGAAVGEQPAGRRRRVLPNPATINLQPVGFRMCAGPGRVAWITWRPGTGGRAAVPGGCLREPGPDRDLRHGRGLRLTTCRNSTWATASTSSTRQRGCRRTASPSLVIARQQRRIPLNAFSFGRSPGATACPAQPYMTWPIARRPGVRPRWTRTAAPCTPISPARRRVHVGRHDGGAAHLSCGRRPRVTSRSTSRSAASGSPSRTSPARPARRPSHDHPISERRGQGPDRGHGGQPRSTQTILRACRMTTPFPEP